MNLQPTTPLDVLTQGFPAGQLDLQIEYGVESIALVRCFGDVCASTVGKLTDVIEAAVNCDYTTIIFDFTYSATDDRAVEAVFAEAMQRNVTVMSTAVIAKMAAYWECSLAAAFRRMTGREAPVHHPLDNGQPIQPSTHSDPNMQAVSPVVRTATAVSAR